MEDEELALTAGGVLAPLVETFDVELGTTRLLAQCVRFLRATGLTSKGLFRVSGDHHLLSLVKIRLAVVILIRPTLAHSLNAQHDS